MDLERAHGLLTIEFEKLEIKLNDLKNENVELDDKNDELIQKNSELEKCNVTLATNLEKEREQSNVKLDLYKKEESKRFKKKSELVDILDATLETKNIEVNDLKEQMSNAFSESETLKGALEDAEKCVFNCKICNFEASNELLLQEHMKIKHEPTCKFCELTFLTSEAQEKHTCKLNINNPEFQEFYIKNWILTHGCSGVYNKHQLK